jgi:hypothetical protein
LGGRLKARPGRGDEGGMRGEEASQTAAGGERGRERGAEGGEENGGGASASDRTATAPAAKPT